MVAIRIFDLYASAVTVSEDPNRYFRVHTDSSKLKFLAIDAVSGKMVHTTFDAERGRIAETMTVERRRPPFADPL